MSDKEVGLFMHLLKEKIEEHESNPCRRDDDTEYLFMKDTLKRLRRLDADDGSF
jgi:hypothetical protein